MRPCLRVRRSCLEHCIHDQRDDAAARTDRLSLLSHNLMVLLELHLADDEGIVDEKIESKRLGRLRLANESMTSIGSGSFSGCARLTGVTIHDRVFVKRRASSFQQFSLWPHSVREQAKA
jgi:hypothetical protein